MTPEKKFQIAVRKDLDKIPNLYYFIKEAMSLRGISDIIGCLNGTFFALELKKDRTSTQAKSGRIVLQKYHIEKIKKAGGFGIITCPETWSKDLQDLKDFANT